MTTKLHVRPPLIHMTSDQVGTFPIDASSRLSVGETIASATATLVDRVSLEDTVNLVVVSSNTTTTVTVKVGPGLELGKKYRLEVLAVVSANKNIPLLLDIDCVA